MPLDPTSAILLTGDGQREGDVSRLSGQISNRGSSRHDDEITMRSHVLRGMPRSLA